MRYVSRIDPSRQFAPGRRFLMTTSAPRRETLSVLDDATRSLVRLSAVVATGGERAVREAISSAHKNVPAIWIEEVLLQTHLFAGFPRALNAMREWRRHEPTPVAGLDDGDVETRRQNGVSTCAAVYGSMYERLRENIRVLHPLLDDWMITEGYGKVLSRPGLDLPRRELCIIAACAASDQERQLHSHLHGALNVGVAPAVIDQTIDAIDDLVGDHAQSARLLWARVRGK